MYKTYAIIKESDVMSNLLKDNKKLMEEYDFEKNTGADLDTITVGSNKRLWWKCIKCGNNWQSKVCNRSNGRGCKICGHKRASEALHKRAASVHNLAKNYPYLKEEWDYKKNFPLKAEDFGYGSEEEVWWKCSWCHSSYRQRINKRALRGYGCPICSKWVSTSFPEQAIYYYVSLLNIKAYNRDTSNKYEFDIYIPSKKIAIEYDGVYWHNSSKKLIIENEKDTYCFKNGINLIRIRNKKLPDTRCATIIEYNEENINDLDHVIKIVLNTICANNSIDVNVLRDTYEIIKKYRTNLKENSLEYKYPKIAKMWDKEKNSGLLPNAIFPNSTVKYWWKCPICNKSWQATANHMVRSDREVTSCPDCSIIRINRGNTIKVVNVDLNIVYDSLTDAAKSVNGRKGELLFAYLFHYSGVKVQFFVI